MKKTIIIISLFLTALVSFGQVTISGHVYNDANGLTDLQINGSGGPYNITNGMNVYLLDTSDNHIIQGIHAVFDTYTFTNVPVNTTYKVVISWLIQCDEYDTFTQTYLPPGWLLVGENLGSGPLSGTDGTRDGMLLIEVGTDNITEANFGIKLAN